MSFSWVDRQMAFNALADSMIDVLVLGGGVVGASTAAHAAQMGMRTTLVEREDLAFGASGNSTGLAHAGLRYLAQGSVAYVFHESRERDRLEEIAPHWVRPFRFFLPIYRDDPFPFWQVSLGTWIYDLMGWSDAILRGRPLQRRHRALNAEELCEHVPGLERNGLQGGVEYFVDAKLQDSRFTMGWAKLAAAHGARIITYADISGLDPTTESLQTLLCTDRLSGKSVQFRTPLVINATGAWIDETRKPMGLTQDVTMPSKGIHLIVDHITSNPMIFNAKPKGRVFFVIPIGTDSSLVGTTDRLVQGPIDPVAPDSQEVDELIRLLFQFFPYFKQGSSLNESIELFRKIHVRDIFWGIRPLLRQSTDTLHASREHRLLKENKTFWSIPGVKLTSGRSVGLEVAQAAWKAIHAREEKCPKLPFTPLPGGDIPDFDRYVQEAQRRFKLDEPSDNVNMIAYLISMYGTDYLKVITLAYEDPANHERLIPEEPWIPAQAIYAAQEEMVLSLNDFLWRRTKWAHLRELPDAAVLRIAKAMAGPMNWSTAEIDSQMTRYYQERQRHRLID
ncbi:MAG: glycerol-3-phosphate dehydrogenase/oxidase [Elusimicrobiota bacterium]|jgi:glycerol-3-phosphate dehydrogenase